MVWRANLNQRLGGRELSTKDVNQSNRFYNCPQATTTTTTTTTPATTTATTTTTAISTTIATTTASTPSTETTSIKTTSTTTTGSATFTDEPNTSTTVIIPNQGFIAFMLFFILHYSIIWCNKRDEETGILQVSRCFCYKSQPT